MKYLILALVSTLFFHCQPPAASSSPVVASTTKSQAEDAKNPKTFRLSGKVVYTRSYCGGAPPSHETMEELQKPIPLANFEMHARPGNVNDQAIKVAYTTRTDKEGNYHFDLPPGEWCIITGEKAVNFGIAMNDPNRLVDQECIEKWAKSCDANIVITNGNKVANEILLHKSCFVGFQPCTQWTGQVPPGAPAR